MTCVICALWSPICDLWSVILLTWSCSLARSLARACRSIDLLIFLFIFIYLFIEPISAIRRVPVQDFLSLPGTLSLQSQTGLTISDTHSPLEQALVGSHPRTETNTSNEDHSKKQFKGISPLIVQCSSEIILRPQHRQIKLSLLLICTICIILHLFYLIIFAFECSSFLHNYFDIAYMY